MHRFTSTLWVRRVLALFVVSVALGSCGFGTAGVVAGLKDKPPTNTPTVIAENSLQVRNAKDPTSAEIGLLAVDAEGDVTSVELFYSIPATGGNRVKLKGIAKNPATLKTSAIGEQALIRWNFSEEPDLDRALTKGVALIAVLGNQSTQTTILDVGNDAPAGRLIRSPGELSGIAALEVALSDSSGDAINVEVEFQDLTGAWQAATAVGAGLVGVPTPRDGSEVAKNFFFWDTNNDLTDVERDVMIRITPFDGTDRGPAVEEQVRVDNNDEPAVQIDGSNLQANPDQRRGLPISFTVFDDEADPVRVIFQWRLDTDKDFEDLGDLVKDPAALAVKLRDPAFRRAKRICSPYPQGTTGRGLPVDAMHVRLPDVMLGRVRAPIANQPLQILRQSTIPASLTGNFPPNSLVRPAAVIPAGDRHLAFILDRRGTASIVSEWSLDTGSLTRELGGGTLPGQPNTMVVERGGSSLLVATEFGTDWSLTRVPIDGSPQTSLATSLQVSLDGPILGVLSLGSDVALVTTEKGLWRLSWRVAANPTVFQLTSGLVRPGGMAQDPLHSNRIWIAETGRDRVIGFNLSTRAIEQLPGTYVGARTLSFDARSNRLVILEDHTASPRVSALALGQPDSEPVVLGAVPGATNLAVGDAGRLTIVVSASPDIVTFGSVAQTRQIIGYDKKTGIAEIDTPFRPSLAQPFRWRMPGREPFFEPVRGARSGVTGLFVWDSRDVQGSGGVILRATCLDTEPGVPAILGSAREVSTGFDSAEALNFLNTLEGVIDLDGDGDLDAFGFGDIYLQGADGEFPAAPSQSLGGFSDVAVDLDRDGILELITLSSGVVRVFGQTAPGVFGTTPRFALASPATTPSPGEVVAADLNGDGRVDIAAATSTGVELWLQDGSAAFPGVTKTLEFGGTFTFFSIATADLDGNGLVDLILGGAVFYQESPGEFGNLVELPGGQGIPSDAGVADFDGDGDLDVVLRTQGRSLTVDLNLVLQQAPREFKVESLSSRVEIFGGRGVLALDADEDGDEDFITSAGDGTAVFYQVAPGRFRSMKQPEPTTIPSTPVTAGDINGDGLVDLAVVGLGGNRVLINRGRGPAPGTAVPDSGDYGFAFGDLDDDGDFDSVTASSGEVVITPQVAFGKFATSARVLLRPDLRPLDVAVADMDADGRMDIVHNSDTFANQPGIFVQYQEDFGFRSALVSPAESRRIVPADLDNDGIVDLVSSGTDDLIRIFFQDAGSSFVELPLGGPGVTGQPNAVAADFNGDGLLDVISANTRTNNVTVFIQTTARAFAANAQVIGGPGITDGPTDVTGADLDADGRLDILTANSSDDVTLFYQEATGFSVRRLTLDDAPTSVTTADLNGDGTLDVITGLAVFRALDRRRFDRRVRQIGTILGVVRAVDFDFDGDVDLIERRINPLSGPPPTAALRWGGR